MSMVHPPSPLPADVVRALAPTGVLRAAINLGNVVLASRSPAGALQGASVALAEEAARRLDLPLELVAFDAAGRVFEALGAWDLAFMAIDPLRSERICFTAPYALIESTYLVPAASPFRSWADLDLPGVRVVASRGSAYELHLRRALRHATLVAPATPEAAYETFVAQRCEALAGVRPALQRMLSRQPGMRLLDEPFLTVQHAMALPRPAVAALDWFETFVAGAISDGFVQRALAHAGQAEAARVPVR